MPYADSTGAILDEWRARFRLANHRERGQLLLELPPELPADEYRVAVRDAWQDSDRQPLAAEDWRRLFSAELPGRAEGLMKDEERKRLAGLPERVEVFRGVNAWNHFSGLSWTLDRERAEWFGARLVTDEGAGVTIAARVLRKRIIAVFDERGEDEVLVFPRYVRNRSYNQVRGES